MLHDHPFGQGNKTSKIEVEVKVGGNRKEGLDKILKRQDRQNRGVFITQRMLGTLCQLGKRMFW